MNKKNLRLYWGENYCPKPEKVNKVLKKTTTKCLKIINQFPGDINEKTIESIAKFHQLNKNQILLGSGIDRLINLVVSSYVKKSNKIASLYPSYKIYEVATNNYGGVFIKIPIKIGQILKSNEIINKLNKTIIFFLAYPNNPTGHYCLSTKELKQLLNKYKGLVIADECYFGIGNKTIINFVNKYKNLIVLRSFSKSVGLAGLRFGYAIANKKIINKLKKFYSEIELDPINIFSCLIAQAILPYLNFLTQSFIKFKKEFIKKLAILKDIEIIKTRTSFTLIKLKKHKNTADIIKKLASCGIFVKNTKFYKNFPTNILMFAVPKKKDWDYFIKTLKKVLN